MTLGTLLQLAGLDLGSLAVLLAAAMVVLALFLVWHASKRETERQRQLDREIAARERGRQKVALARALLFEVDNFYRHYLSEVAETLTGSEGAEGQYPVVTGTAGEPFPIYTANASRLADLDEETLEELIYYHGAANAYLALLRDYRSAMERVLRKEAMELAIPEARLHLSRIREALPELIQFTASLCRKLCDITGVPYQYLRVAAESGEAQRRPRASLYKVPEADVAARTEQHPSSRKVAPFNFPRKPVN